VSDNFQQAASRHWRDANVLYHEGAYENADQLLGLAAECAIKYALGMSGRIHKNVHIDELWDKVTPNYVSRQFATLAVILQQFRPNPWSNWSIEQRYFADGYVTQPDVERHKNITKRVCGAVNILGVRS